MLPSRMDDAVIDVVPADVLDPLYVAGSSTSAGRGAAVYGSDAIGVINLTKTSARNGSVSPGQHTVSKATKARSELGRVFQAGKYATPR